MSKPFMTYDQQLEKLKEKHLQVQDEAAAREALRRIGYFSLVGGYKSLFKNPTTRLYRDGTDFQDLLSLYRFDERLRELTLRHLLHIEQNIRAELSYAFCSRYGERQEAYLTAENYDQTAARRQEIDALLEKHLRPLLDRKTDYPYLEHCKQTHHNVPLWVLVKALTFGTISKMYSLSKPQVRSAVSRSFEGIREKQLGQLLQVLTVYRNVCAHGERLFSYRSARREIPDLPVHQTLGIRQKGAQYLQGKRDYFAVAVAFRCLLPEEEFQQYKEQLALLIEALAQENRQLTRRDLFGQMGLPDNWQLM